MFYGIVVRMLCSPGEHNPPHIAAYYHDFMTIIDIPTGEITAESLPPKPTKHVTRHHGRIVGVVMHEEM